MITKIAQPPYIHMSVVRGGGLVQPWRILRANADCTLFLFPLYCFPFCLLQFCDTCSELSPCSQFHKTGKVMQTSMFRTNKKALICMRFEQNEFKNFILSFKNHLHMF